MKIKYAVAAALTALLMTGCAMEVDDGGTAADRADVNNQDAKSKDKKSKDKATSKKADSEPKETVAQENARESAESYLNMSAFSRKGLIEQLEFEGFSRQDAEYGVDAQNADWMKQAAASAESYLEMSSFSRQGLIDQLKFEGFTPEQAAHGATAVGL
ncbi:Ltp family lipoprotein [Nocardioides sp. Y6]|uniref:Ltp family lipoprotein n=1 Tax=Nocardioides malaquae TaxID=2773426 RepID=A0ABR9RUB0_9ACTN|nr:Ltp family lipoprotein [Nocardioides malaquae]MBE7325166.1 Ltp family lipoprotein [Nocardioides malaquae]